MSTPGYESMSAVEVRRAAHVQYALSMISDIAAEYDAVVANGPRLCADAMLESFHLNIRLLADFLVKRTDARDFGPADFGVEWTIPRTPAAERLGTHWQEASTYIFHFGKNRTPENLDELDLVHHTGESLREMAKDAVEVMASFVQKVLAQPNGSPGAAAILKNGFIDACQRLGLNHERLLSPA